MKRRTSAFYCSAGQLPPVCFCTVVSMQARGLGAYAATTPMAVAVQCSPMWSEQQEMWLLVCVVPNTKDLPLVVDLDRAL